MTVDTVNITINMDKRCTQCRRLGATPSGLCLSCVGRRMVEQMRLEKAPKPPKDDI